MPKINLNIVTPEEKTFESEVDEVYLTTPLGEIGILPSHENLMTKILAGELRIKNNGKVTIMAVGSGLLQMADNNLSIMTDLAEEAEHIDLAIAEQAKVLAQQALEQTQTDEGYAV